MLHSCYLSEKLFEGLSNRLFDELVWILFKIAQEPVCKALREEIQTHVLVKCLDDGRDESDK